MQLGPQQAQRAICQLSIGRLTSTASNTKHIARCACLNPSFRWYSLRLPMEGWPGWVDLGGWLHTQIVFLPADYHASKYQPDPVLINFVDVNNDVSNIEDNPTAHTNKSKLKQHNCPKGTSKASSSLTTTKNRVVLTKTVRWNYSTIHTTSGWST